MIFNIEDLRNYCLQKKGVTESFPFDETTLVFKLVNKIFAITNLNNEVLSVNLKCEPQKAIELRNKFEQNILPGYHMNKKHWNTVIINSSLNPKMVIQLIDESYNLIYKKLKKVEKESLDKL